MTKFQRTDLSFMDKKLPAIIKNTAKDILEIKIQGATNVAIATFKALREWLESSEFNTREALLTLYERYGALLANIRPNEPLAKNGIRYVNYYIRTKYSSVKEISSLKSKLIELSEAYLELIQNSKKKIVKQGFEYVKEAKIIFTHCHSSTAENLIKGANAYRKKIVVATETRPLFQGHITVRNLLKAGVETVMIVDAAAPYFIKDDSFYPVDVVLLGADEITVFGDAVNKIGSFAMGISAYFAGKPLYIVTPSLKVDLSTLYKPVHLELRDGKEVWKQAPKGLKVINPAFDIVPREFITGYITELGLLKPQELEKEVRLNYEWIT